MLNDGFRQIIIIDKEELEEMIRKIVREEHQNTADDNLLTMQEVAQKLRMSYNTLKRNIESGHISLYPIYFNNKRPKFSKIEVEKIINNLKQ